MSTIHMASAGDTIVEPSNGQATLASTVYERLRADILGGALTPGAKLRVEAVCQRYEAGASPVREALSRLVPEGLVERHEQRGFSVAPASLEELHELVETRCMVEEIALRRSIARRDAAWEEAIVLALHRLTRMVRAEPAAEYRPNPAWERLHGALHDALIANCGSRSLRKFCAELRDKADRYRNLAAAHVHPARNDPHEHRAIVEAVIDGRADEAVALLTAHYRRTLELVEQALPKLGG